MIKTYIPLVLTLVIGTASPVFAGISDFAHNHDIAVSEEGIITAKPGYLGGNDANKKIYSKKDYKFISEDLSNGQARKLLEIEKNSPSESKSTAVLQMARFSGSTAASLTKCKATDRSSDYKLGKALNVRLFNLNGCATATPKVCASLAAFLGKSSEAIAKKINDCRDVTDAMAALQKTMSDSLYKKTSDNNIQELSDAYYEMVHPKENKLDSRKETNRAVAPETDFDYMKGDVNNLVELTETCTRLGEVNEDGIYSTKKKYEAEGSTTSGSPAADRAIK